MVAEMLNCRWGGMLLLVFACCGCQDDAAPDADGAKDGDLVSVKVVHPTRQPLQRTTTQPGTIHAYHRAESYAKVAGYLKTLHVDIGSEVEENTPLAVIDVPEIEIAKEKQQATIQRLIANEGRHVASKELAAAGIKAAEAMRDEAVADVAKSAAQLTADQLEYERLQSLVKSKVVPKQLEEEAKKRRDTSQAAKNAADAAHRSAMANVTVATQQQSVAAADWLAALEETKVARKQLEEIEVLVEFATLRAPFKGVVTERNVDRGDLVRNIQSTSGDGGKPLFAIEQLDRVRIQIAVPENDAPWANKDDKVTLKLKSLVGRVLEGDDIVISRIAGVLDQSTRTMLVEVDLLNDDGALLPGMYGEATIILEVKPSALLLPVTALRHSKERPNFVYVLDGQDKVSIVNVVTGIDNVVTGTDEVKKIEITSGLDENARVVDSTIGGLAAGQVVRVMGK
jgi:RND family efflux transporter MFP subunit